VKDNQLLRALVQVQGQNGTSTIRGEARYALGDHPVAEKVRALEIDRTSIARDRQKEREAKITPVKGYPGGHY
jgi:hypothetical protein